MSELKHVGGKVVIESLEDINQYIEENFPDGLEAKRKHNWYEKGDRVPTLVLTSIDLLTAI